jgi:hypothetical protein
MPGTSTWTTPDAARDYIRRGFCPVPFPRGAKGPTVTGWTSWRLTEDDVPREFRPDHNMGIRLGDDVGRLICVDLDCPEALALAPDFLLPTPAVLGRPNRPASHWLYRVAADGGTGRSLRDRLTGKPVVEVLYNGRQVVVGPSVHPDDGDIYDSIDFTLDDVPVIPRRSLDACVEALHDACLQQRYADDPQKLEHARNGRASSTPVMLPAAPADPDGVPYDQRVRRGEAYAANTPGAISGSGGHNQTYALATALVHGLCLSPADARDILAEYNVRCEPPWSDRELDHKIEEAASKAHERPRGWLLADGQSSEATPRVDLSGITGRGHQEPTESAQREKFPADLLDVPGFVGEVIDCNLASAHRAQPILALSGALCLQACLTGLRVRDEYGNWPSLYVINVADPSGGKESARKINGKVLDKLIQPNSDDKLWYDSIRSDVGLRNAVRDTPNALFQVDEFGRFLATLGSAGRSPHLFNIMTELMKLYGTVGHGTGACAYADTKRNVAIEGQCLSLLGTTASDPLYASLTMANINDGALGRFLIFESDEFPSLEPKVQKPLPESILKRARAWTSIPILTRMNAIRDPAIAPVTPDAFAIIRQLIALADSRIREQDPFAGLWGRCGEKVFRLALTWACSQTDDPHQVIVDAAAAQWASRLVRCLTERLIQMARRHVADGEYEQKCKRVLETLRRWQPIAHSPFSQKIRFVGKATERNAIIADLLSTGDIVRDADGLYFVAA